MLLIFLITIFIRPFICSLAFPYADTTWFIVAAFLFIAYVLYLKPVFPKNKTILYPILLFFSALLISIFFSRNKLNSFAEIHTYIAGILLFFVAASLSDRDKTLVIKAIVISGVVISFFAIYQYFFGFKHVLNYLSKNYLSLPYVLECVQSKRVFLPFVTPNALGGYLALVLPLAMISQSWVILPILFALLLTKSLGALLALFLALIYYFYRQNKLKRSNIIFLIMLFVLICTIFISRSETQKIHSRPLLSTIMRLNYWQETLEVIKAHPFVGVGPGNLSLKMSRYAHNSYLQIWAEMGIFGLISFIWIVFSVFLSVSRNVKNLFYKGQITILITAGTVFLIHNFFDFTFYLPEVVSAWWVILGLVMVKEKDMP